MKTILILFTMLSLTSQAFSQSAKASLSSSNAANVSITSSDRDYSLIASFQVAKSPKIEKAITDELGAPTDHKDDLSVWLYQGEYTVTLRSEKLIIDLDKKSAAAPMIKKFEKLGKRLSNIISGTK
jgi:hypothetical protein